MKNFEQPLHVPVIVTDPDQLAGVYAVLASSSALAAALAAVNGGAIAAPIAERPRPAPSSDNPPVAGIAKDAEKASGEVELDAHGHPWSAELHAGTKGKTKEDLWRMKPGVNRPDPLPGYPLDDAPGKTDTGTKDAGKASDAGASAADADADEDDEFAEFASSKDDVEIPARSWTDADLSKLANQAAQAMGGPAEVKKLIGEYVAEGEIARSSNIPADKREDFAQALEKLADIEFAG